MAGTGKNGSSNVYLAIAAIGLGTAVVGAMWMQLRSGSSDGAEVGASDEWLDAEEGSERPFRARRIGRTAQPPVLDEPAASLDGVHAAAAPELSEEEMQRFVDSQARRREAQERIMRETGRTPEGFEVPPGGFVVADPEED